MKDLSSAFSQIQPLAFCLHPFAFPLGPQLATVLSLMHLSTLDVAKGISVNVFDVILVIWLIVGLIRGRKHGMSEELMLLVQWVLIVVLCGHFYRPAGTFIHDTFYSITPIWAYIISYLLIALGISTLISKLKRKTGEKLFGSDFFGKGEYYFGMLAGVLRFACMAFVLLALMNARIISKAERDETEKMQKKAFEDIRFPTYGTIQQTVLFESFSGKAAREYLMDYMIVSVLPSLPPPPRDNIGTREQRALDEVIGPAKK